MVSIRRRKHLLARIKLETTRCTENQEGLAVANPEDFGPSSTPRALRIDFRDKELKRRKLHRRKVVSDNPEACALRGVYFKNSKWQAAIKVGKKQVHLGTVNTQEEAAHLYDRAAYMCGREPNFELLEEEKLELQSFEWEEFLAVTKRAIAQKKMQNKLLAQSKRRQAAITALTERKLEHTAAPAPATPMPGSPSPSSQPESPIKNASLPSPTSAHETPMAEAETGFTVPSTPPTPVPLPVGSPKYSADAEASTAQT